MTEKAKYLKNEKTGMVIPWHDVQAEKKHMVPCDGPTAKKAPAAVVPETAPENPPGDELDGMKRGDLFALCQAEKVTVESSSTNEEMRTLIREARAAKAGK